MTRILPLLLLLACLLSPPVQAQERPWSYVVWDNGETPTAVSVEVWGLAELREDLRAEPPTHGTVSFWIDGPCWRVTVTGGGRVWRWEETRGCFNYRFPMVGAAGR